MYQSITNNQQIFKKKITIVIELPESLKQIISTALYHERALFIKMIGRIDNNPLGGMTVCHVASFHDHHDRKTGH